MPARSGEPFLKGLRARNREVWLGAERVDDVTTHPQLEGAARSLARVFDIQQEFADETAIYPGLPLPADAPSTYALSVALPMDTPGLIFLCRDSAATVGSTSFDHPLSSRFDEQDAYTIFDDVEVPYELALALAKCATEWNDSSGTKESRAFHRGVCLCGTFIWSPLLPCSV